MTGTDRRPKTTRTHPVYSSLAAQAAMELRQGQRIAAQLQQAHPAWLVMYGLASRKFWAYPLWPSHQGNRMSDVGPNELAARMRAAELAVRPGLTQLPEFSQTSPAAPAADTRRGDRGSNPPARPSGTV